MDRETKVLAMYDVRGIQDYIFRTNRVKDIIGASLLVEHIIEDALKSACAQTESQGRVVLDWETEKGQIASLRGVDVDAEVLFIGGGNAYILYRSRAFCQEISRRMARYVLEHTYSLQLATAVIERTENYFEDYKSLNAEMTRIK
ncbi:MAG: hypothetical protein LUE31_06640 [Lachnospiraceae bacterium]|nr:hypothetical protein [Lachnospiraceae bacterium]